MRNNPSSQSVNPLSGAITRRGFIGTASRAMSAAALAIAGLDTRSQEPGQRPRKPDSVAVLNPRCRVPVGLIIDDSTCLVNLNRFAMPQFDRAHRGKNPAYKKPWRDWPPEIPDSFVRRFAEWSIATGVRGKYSVVPYPACVGRLDRLLPGWSHSDLEDSLDLVRTLVAQNWDIHPEMITHTRVIDLRTGQPYQDDSLAYMENWDWSAGKSAAELADYLAYALQILKNAGLECEGITTPGGFGSRARPQLAQATLEAVRSVFGAQVPHYFRDVHDKGDESVAPRVELASGLDGPDPKCVVSVIGCTGDWTGGWDCSEPEGADRFISSDLKTGRMVEVIERGEPAMMLCHWTGIYWNGHEFGFKILQEVVRRLHARYDNLIWMKLSELARYWAARELTRIASETGICRFDAPFAWRDFTVEVDRPVSTDPKLRTDQQTIAFREVGDRLKLVNGTWCRENGKSVFCFDLPAGTSRLIM
ncbi:MAG: hypothetical protein GX456_19615 [Verrucomicrobia bacterium]|nr:hypothetical protein [Verrucomicrobiota bacterium]